MNRRAFLGGFASGLLAAPRVTGAQPADRVYRLGIIAINPRSAPYIQAFEQRLRALGGADGKNLAIVFRSPRRLQDAPAMAVDLLRQNVDVIVAGGPEPNLSAATEATRTIPIVMVALNRGPYRRAADYVDRIFRDARPTFPSSSRRGTSWSSTSGPRRPWA